MNDEIDLAEFELKLEATLDDAEKWWDSIEPEEKATIYIRNKDKDYMEEKEEIAKKFIEYECGHTSDGVLILDSNELSIASYFEWSESVGIFGNKTKCWDCWCNIEKSKVSGGKE